jgi:DNA-binding NarL/FixJ family response regulator
LQFALAAARRDSGMLDLLIMAPSPARRDWLSKCVQIDPEMRIAGKASTFPFLKSLISETSADVLLIELEPDTEYATVRDWVREFFDLMPVVLLISDAEPAMVNLMRSAKTGGLLQSTASSDQINLAIRSVAFGLTVVDSALLPEPAHDETAAEQLTPREGEVLRLLADGLPNKEIALKLGISEHTIKFHIRSILGKLGVASRTEAVTRGLRNGLIEL